MIPGMRGGGGAERSLAAVVPQLAQSIDLEIVTLNGRTHLRPDVEAGGGTLTDVSAATAGRTFLRLRDHLRRVRPDIVHTTLVEAHLVGRPAAASIGVPVVSSLVNDHHGVAGVRSGPHRTKRSVVWAADAATARSVVRFQALTQHVADVMALRLLISPHRIDVIPRGREPSQLGRRSPDRRERVRHELGVTDSQLLVVAAARHEVQKGLDVLLRCIPLVRNHLPSVRFIVAGRDGSATPSLTALVESLGIGDAVEFVGHRDDVADLMCAADLWCVPSRWEGFGGILLEAMAMEVPLIASDVPAVREVAGTPPVFRLVRPDDPEQLAVAVVEALVDPDGSAHDTARARARFLDEYSSTSVSDRLLAFYDDARAASRLARGG